MNYIVKGNGENSMSQYVELSVDSIELDKSNPRIARGLAYYDPIPSEIMALLLGSTSEACASLKWWIQPS